MWKAATHLSKRAAFWRTCDATRRAGCSRSACPPIGPCDCTPPARPFCLSRSPSLLIRAHGGPCEAGIGNGFPALLSMLSLYPRFRESGRLITGVIITAHLNPVSLFPCLAGDTHCKLQCGAEALGVRERDPQWLPLHTNLAESTPKSSVSFTWQSHSPIFSISP
jgi:hypothetical protein